MRNYFVSITTALSIGFMGLSLPAKAEVNLDQETIAKKVNIALPEEAAKPEKKKDNAAAKLASAAVKEFSFDEIKGVFNTAAQKTQKDLQDYTVKTGKKPSFFRDFFTGFKHGFLETAKYAIKKVIKLAPTLIMLLA